MRNSAVILSAFHFVLSLCLLFLGVFSLGVGKVTQVKYNLIRFLDNHPDFFSLLGMSLIAVGAVLFVTLFTVYRKAFYQLKMGVNDAEINPRLVESYVSDCLKEVLKEKSSSCEVVIKPNQTIEIFTKLSFCTPQEHLDTLESIKPQLAHVLKKYLGYEKDFLLTVTVSDS